MIQLSIISFSKPTAAAATRGRAIEEARRRSTATSNTYLYLNCYVCCCVVCWIGGHCDRFSFYYCLVDCFDGCSNFVTGLSGEWERTRLIRQRGHRIQLVHHNLKQREHRSLKPRVHHNLKPRVLRNLRLRVHRNLKPLVHHNLRPRVHHNRRLRVHRSLKLLGHHNRRPVLRSLILRGHHS